MDVVTDSGVANSTAKVRMFRIKVWFRLQSAAKHITHKFLQLLLSAASDERQSGLKYDYTAAPFHVREVCLWRTGSMHGRHRHQSCRNGQDAYATPRYIAFA